MSKHPYIPQEPGNLITAEDWNELQEKIQDDIESKIADSEQKIKTEGVDQAGNADKFAEDTPDAWIEKLNELYAPKVHDHEGQSEYRRFIKQFTNKLYDRTN